LRQHTCKRRFARMQESAFQRWSLTARRSVCFSGRASHAYNPPNPDEPSARPHTVSSDTHIEGRTERRLTAEYVAARALAESARREGVHAAFALPILAQRQVTGVMEFFSREIREPDKDLLRMLTQVGSHIGQFIERKRAEEELDRFFTLSLDLLCLAGFDGYFK